MECQINALKRVRNRNQLDECLRSLPRDLDETYERILCSIDNTYVEDVQRILTILCCSSRPLTIDELIHAHAVDLSEPPHFDHEGRSYAHDDLIDICLGLVEVSDDKNGQSTVTARIAHFSVQEYLQSDRILKQKADIFAIRSGPANTEITQICLVYILEAALLNGILDKEKLKDFPLAQFAATHWHSHYQKSHEGVPKTEGLLLKIFRGNKEFFMNWIRLHDMDYPKKEIIDLEHPAGSIASPIYYAAMLGVGFVLKDILVIAARNANIQDIVNAQGGRYGNALQAASRGGHEKVVQTLLDIGADINA